MVGVVLADSEEMRGTIPPPPQRQLASNCDGDDGAAASMTNGDGATTGAGTNEFAVVK